MGKPTMSFTISPRSANQYLSSKKKQIARFSEDFSKQTAEKFTKEAVAQFTDSSVAHYEGSLSDFNATRGRAPQKLAHGYYKAIITGPAVQFIEFGTGTIADGEYFGTIPPGYTPGGGESKMYSGNGVEYWIYEKDGAMIRAHKTWTNKYKKIKESGGQSHTEVVGKYEHKGNSYISFGWLPSHIFFNLRKTYSENMYKNAKVSIRKYLK